VNAVGIKAFVPAKGFELFKQFHQEIDHTLTAVRTSIMNVCLLLQTFSVKELAETFQMHLLVEHVDVWWAHIEARGIAERGCILLILLAC